MNKKWRKLSSELILERERIKIFEDEVMLPSGHKISYIHFGKSNGSVMIIAKRNDGKILVQKEYSYPVDEWLYQLPGGGIEEDEDPASGAMRELQEEAGLRGGLEELGWFYYNNRRSDAKMHVFLATNLTPTAKNHDLEEEFEDFWLSEEQIDKMIKSQEIVNITLIAGWLLYKNNAPNSK